MTFSLSLNRGSVQVLRARNSSSDAYSFKVKTTNPKRYSVRPNMGIVFPRQDAEVNVQMPPVKEYPSDMNKCKDKFQVLTLKLDGKKAEELAAMGSGSEAQRTALTALWAADDAKLAIVDKIKCAFAFDSNYRDVAIPEEESNVAPYSPDSNVAGRAGAPPQTPYAEAMADDIAIHRELALASAEEAM